MSEMSSTSRCGASQWRVPGVGQYVSFFDSEGNRVSMLQPAPTVPAKGELQSISPISGPILR
jgi:hypothetical protein